MNRAKVICHMAITTDGKINGNMERCKNYNLYSTDYFQILTDHFDTNTRLHILGRKTLAPDGQKAAQLPKSDMSHDVLRKDFVEPFAKNADATWIAVVDGHGRYAWAAPTLTGSFPEMEGNRLMPAVVEDWVSDDFLAHCHRTGIPYLFCGKDKFEPVILLQKAKQLLGQDTAVLMGGGITNSSFLKCDCIDELSVVISPFVSANPKDVSLFEPIPGDKDALPWANFTAVKTAATPNGHLWTHYTHDKEPLPRV